MTRGGLGANFGKMPLSEMALKGSNMVDDGRLPAQYVSGLVDGEGCFVLGFRRDKKYRRTGQPEYYYWTVEFAILLRSDDWELLEKVRKTLGCGGISISETAAQYRVYGIDDLKQKVVPFFAMNRIYGKKGKDFALWAEAVDILHEKHLRSKSIDRRGVWGAPRIRLDSQQNQRMLALKAGMEAYKAKGRPWKWMSKIGGTGCED